MIGLDGQLALYTTVYPGVEKYLLGWYRSVLEQKDQDFDLWIGVDTINTADVANVLGEAPNCHWVIGETGDTPAQIRNAAIQTMVDKYPAIIFVDSDDHLLPTRVESARKYLASYDVIACAMSLMDKEGNDLGQRFGPPEYRHPNNQPPYPLKTNVFGLSNSAYRSEVLIRCLPVPMYCTLVDWYLATCAWTSGAHMFYDPDCQMRYRQYRDSPTRVTQPFSSIQILHATRLVLEHYDCILKDSPVRSPTHRQELQEARQDVLLFRKKILSSEATLHQYSNALNHLEMDHIWWESVAHPALEVTQ